MSGPVLAPALNSRAQGEPLGAALVRSGELNPLRLQVELEELSLALAARIVVADGSFAATTGPAVPAGRETVDRSLRALFAAGVRRVPDVEVLKRLLGGGARWEAVPATVGIDKGFEPGGLERFVLDQLTPATTLDALRALAPDQFLDTVRALAVLVATELAAPQRKPSSVVDTAIHAQSPPAATGPASARVLPPASPRVKELLARLEEVELEAMARYSGASAQPRETFNRRKGESFRRTALRILAEGEDEKVT